MKLYNPFKWHVVQFRDKSFAARRLAFTQRYHWTLWTLFELQWLRVRDTGRILVSWEETYNFRSADRVAVEALIHNYKRQVMLDKEAKRKDYGKAV